MIAAPPCIALLSVALLASVVVLADHHEGGTVMEDITTDPLLSPQQRYMLAEKAQMAAEFNQGELNEEDEDEAQEEEATSGGFSEPAQLLTKLKANPRPVAKAQVIPKKTTAVTPSANQGGPSAIEKGFEIVEKAKVNAKAKMLRAKSTRLNTFSAKKVVESAPIRNPARQTSQVQGGPSAIEKGFEIVEKAKVNAKAKMLRAKSTRLNTFSARKVVKSRTPNKNMLKQAKVKQEEEEAANATPAAQKMVTKRTPPAQKMIKSTHPEALPIMPPLVKTAAPKASPRGHDKAYRRTTTFKLLPEKPPEGPPKKVSLDRIRHAFEIVESAKSTKATQRVKKNASTDEMAVLKKQIAQLRKKIATNRVMKHKATEQKASMLSMPPMPHIVVTSKTLPSLSQQRLAVISQIKKSAERGRKRARGDLPVMPPVASVRQRAAERTIKRTVKKIRKAAERSRKKKATTTSESHAKRRVKVMAKAGRVNAIATAKPTKLPPIPPVRPSMPPVVKHTTKKAALTTTVTEMPPVVSGDDVLAKLMEARDDIMKAAAASPVKENLTPHARLAAIKKARLDRIKHTVAKITAAQEAKAEARHEVSKAERRGKDAAVTVSAEVEASTLRKDKKRRASAEQEVQRTIKVEKAARSKSLEAARALAKQRPKLRKALRDATKRLKKAHVAAAGAAQALVSVKEAHENARIHTAQVFLATMQQQRRQAEHKRAKLVLLLNSAQEAASMLKTHDSIGAVAKGRTDKAAGHHVYDTYVHGPLSPGPQMEAIVTEEEATHVEEAKISDAFSSDPLSDGKASSNPHAKVPRTALAAEPTKSAKAKRRAEHKIGQWYEVPGTGMKKSQHHQETTHRVPTKTLSESNADKGKWHGTWYQVDGFSKSLPGGTLPGDT